jgi:hypothetical protein
MTRTRSLALPAAAALAWAAACHDSTAPTAGTDRTYLRVVNSAFQATAAPTTSNPFGCPCTPLAIDVLIDSSTAAPSAIGMPAASVGVGSEGPAPANVNAFYSGLAPGLHSFVARAAGATNPSFFTTPAGSTYLPKQYLPGGIRHTLVVAGVNPAQPAAGAPVLASNTAFASDTNLFPLYPDDPFTPPTVQGASGPTLQSRYRVINAAPFSAAGLFGTTVFLTEGATPPSPTTLATTVATVITAPRVASFYFNVKPGAYTVTIKTAFGNPYYQGPVTLGAGEVRTLVLQNTVPPGVAAIPAGGPPAASVSQYYKLTNILDNRY